MDRSSYQFWSEKLYRRAIQMIASRFYLDSNQDPGKSILVAGTARSGTTWLADLISAQIPCRLVFEPFNPVLVRDYRAFQYFQYMRPEQQDSALYVFAQKVFSGQLRNRWVDHKNEKLLPRFRLVKEIRANLLLKWLHDNFPEVPLLFMIRHPCAVVLSRMELGWATDKDIEPFLSQAALVSDHLSDYVQLIKSAQSDEEKHAIIWCVSNLIPLQQFRSGELKIVFYEDLCTLPEQELSKILQYIFQRHQPLRRIEADRPSPTTKMTGAVVTGVEKITRWQKSLSSAQVTKILSVVRRFGLENLYGNEVAPLQAGLGKCCK